MSPYVLAGPMMIFIRTEDGFEQATEDYALSLNVGIRAELGTTKGVRILPEVRYEFEATKVFKADVEIARQEFRPQNEPDSAFSAFDCTFSLGLDCPQRSNGSMIRPPKWCRLGGRVSSTSADLFHPIPLETMKIQKQLVDRLYRQGLRGVPGFGTPTDTAEQGLGESSSANHAAKRLCRRYEVLSGLTGFVCGLPGYATMPVTIPSNVAGVLLLQLHLCATLAELGDLDPESDEARAIARECVMNVDDGAASDRAGIRALLQRVGIKLGERGLRLISEQVVRRWANRGGRRLPLVGGIVGAYSDLRTTRRVGERARARYLDTSTA